MDGQLEDGKEAKETQEIRMLVENQHVGGIIGKGGANVKRVREDTGVFLSILKTEFRNVQDRVMVVKGPTEQVGEAIKQIADLIIDASAGRAADKEAGATTSVKLLVHRSAVGAIIGKGGAVIKETQVETGARIQISNEPLPSSTEKTVTISGTAEVIHEAVNRVLQQLRDNPLRAGTKVYNYVPGQPLFAPSPHFGIPVGAPYGQPMAHGLSAYGVQQPTSTQKIAIPTLCAGGVIGKGGSVIRDLRAQSGTNISIADPDANPNERIVTITGTPQGIQTAIYLIRQLVEQYQPGPQY